MISHQEQVNEEIPFVQVPVHRYHKMYQSLMKYFLFGRKIMISNWIARYVTFFWYHSTASKWMYSIRIKYHSKNRNFWSEIAIAMQASKWIYGKTIVKVNVRLTIERQNRENTLHSISKCTFYHIFSNIFCLSLSHSHSHFDGVESFQWTNIRIRYFYWKFHRQHYEWKNVQFQVHLLETVRNVQCTRNTNLMLFSLLAFHASLKRSDFFPYLSWTCFDWDGPYIVFGEITGWVIIAIDVLDKWKEQSNGQG